MPKKKLLLIGIVMHCAGTEKSFLSFASHLDYEAYDVTLLLAKKEGFLIDQIPPQIRVIEMEKYGEMFLLSGANAARTIWNSFVRRNPLTLFEVFPYFAGILLCPRKKADIATRMWCHFLQKFPPLREEYDVAAAYWGDRTMFYLVDRVKAKKKIAWLHFDYGQPPRDDKLYHRYFAKCDSIVTVSDAIDTSLRAHFPDLADRCVMMENINDPALIRRLAQNGDTFSDNFDGTRILTIGRICEQKGLDFAVEALIRLRRDGKNVRWYILGEGENADIDALRMQAKAGGVESEMIFLGKTVNPYRYLHDCDLYVQPSRYEGKPITVEEAKMLCRPIVACNYLSANEQLHNGDWGMVVPIGADGLYEGITKMLDDPARGKQYEEALRKCDFSNASQMAVFEKMAAD